jgi:drug/metabolite transporter (DMT)-like permease
MAHWKFILPFTLISIVGFNSVFYVALHKTTALQASLIQSVLPVLVLLLGRVFLGARITSRQWWGVVFSISGAMLIMTRGDVGIFATLQLFEGDLWALGAVALWALQAFMMRWKPPTIEIMPFMTILSLIGVIVMTPLYAWETVTVAAMPFNRTTVLMVLYVGVFAAVLGTSMWNEGTYRAGAAEAGYFGNLFPIFAGGLAILILGETMHWYHAVGAGLVLVGIWLATAIRSRRPPAA